MKRLKAKRFTIKQSNHNGKIMMVKIYALDLVTYAWLRHFAKEKVPRSEKKALFGLHLDIILNGTEAYYNTETDELELKNPKTARYMYLSQFVKALRTKYYL
jgi:hypothetical protein